MFGVSQCLLRETSSPNRRIAIPLHEVIVLQDLWILRRHGFADALWEQAGVEQSKSRPSLRHQMFSSTHVVEEFDFGDRTGLLIFNAFSEKLANWYRLIDHSELSGHWTRNAKGELGHASRRRNPLTNWRMSFDVSQVSRELRLDVPIYLERKAGKIDKLFRVAHQMELECNTI